MYLNFFLSLMMFMISCVMFSYFHKHTLMVLISLEFMVVSVYFNMYVILIELQMNMYMMIFFLVMSVCEGALGLSLIVLMVRFHGNDYLNSLSVLKW